MTDSTIVRLSQLDQCKRLEAVDLFVDSFQNVFTFTKSKLDLVKLISASFCNSSIYVYLAENQVAGILGLGTNTQRALHFDKKLCQTIFGDIKGRIIYGILHRIAEIPAVKNDTDLYIDYLATDSKLRNRGVATKLLDFAGELPLFEECYIEVLSKNVAALKLYKKLGFAVHKRSFNFFTFTQKLGHPIMMKKLIKHKEIEACSVELLDEIPSKKCHW